MKTSLNPIAPRAPILVSPIGVVHSGFTDVTQPMDYAAESRVEIFPELLPALTGIENFSHLWVIYHQHRSAEWRQTHGWGKEPSLVNPPIDDRSGQGIFTSRAPARPAALGSCKWIERGREQPPWQARLESNRDSLELNLSDLDWPDAAAVMNAVERDLLSASETSLGEANPRAALSPGTR